MAWIYFHTQETTHAERNISVTLDTPQITINVTGMNKTDASYWPSPILMLTTVTMSIITVVTVFGNLLVISSVIMNRSLHGTTHYLIASLAFADMFVGLLVFPPAITMNHLGHWPFSWKPLCIMWISADILMCHASILNLCCISIDRYISITHPIGYLAVRSNRLATVMISIAWGLPVITVVVPLFGSASHLVTETICMISPSRPFRIYATIMCFAAPLTLICFVYLHIIVAVRRRPAPSAAYISRRQHCPQQSSVLQQKPTHTSAGGDILMRSNDSHVDKSETELHPRLESMYFLKHTRLSDTNYQKYSVQKGGSIQGAQLDHLNKHLKGRKNNALNRSEIVRQSLSSPLKQPPQNYLQWQSCSEPCYLNNMNETVQKIADYVPMLKIGPYNGRSLQNMKHSDKLTMECENGKAQFINSESRSREVIEMALVTTGRQQLAGERETDHASDFTAHKARETEMSIVRRRRPYMFVLMLGQQISSILRHLFTSVSLHRLRSQIADPSDSFFLSAAQENSEMGAAYIPGAYSQYGRLRRVRIKRKMKTLTVVTSVIGCFAVCWIPFFVCFILEAYVGLLPHELTLFVTLLGYANSVCNPFIYALLDNRYSKTYLEVIRCEYCRLFWCKAPLSK
ncbi:5-hydroxytryptamine receptor 7 [Clonorchis sinensis]|uniref:5-hydroxytryptamine receptor 7 n=1 Tax=Clonorchis sinensis TaxID=79923 RepID=A0A419PWF8_CLOSI|nr:5-hydroxytryptamine receptor 7 [Clonorchis sinensis]